LAVALAVYVGLMGVHIVTGLAAVGLISSAAIDGLAHWTQVALASVI